MKQKQVSWFTGYVTVEIRGDVPEQFFQECSRQGIPVWDIKKMSSDLCQGNVKLTDIKAIKQVIRKSDYKLTFSKRSGYPFVIRRFRRKKELLLALAMSVLLVLILSNIIWKVEIAGVPTDIEEKISQQLEEYGIHPGAWIFTLDSPSDIQQQLIEDVPELLWAGIQQNGTTFYLEGVEKLLVEEEENLAPRNLVATKKGVIKYMYVSKGVPAVEVNDYVQPGDLLVAGNLNEETESDELEEEEDSQQTLVAAQGEITATTWYEVDVTVPFEADYETLTGNRETKYYLEFGSVRIPIWGFSDPEYELKAYETDKEPLRFFNWTLPISFVEETISEKVHTNTERTKDEAITAGIQQAKNELALELGPEAEFISEKVLQETTESGKVKLNIYMTVEEDIATPQLISAEQDE